MGVKISDLTAKGSKIASTDIVEVSVDTGLSFVSRKVTGSELNELSLDTSPQLGGNLDVNSNKITSASNGNIKIEPNGTGAVLIGGNDNQPSELRFMELLSNGSSYVGFKAPNDIITSRVYTLPTADGTNGQVLSTNGTGTLSWATAGGGLTIGTTAITSGTVGRILFEGTGNVLQEDSALFWDNTNKRLGIGATPSTSVRLDVRAQGALSTDIAFRVRNSADNKNIVEVRGDGETRWNGLPAVGNYVAIKNYTSYDATIDLMGGNSVKAQISMDIASNLNINRGLNIWNPGIVGQSTSKINNIVKSGLEAYGAGYGFNWAFTSNASGVFTQSERVLWLTSTKSMVLYNGSSITDAHSEKADSFEMYSADITAGNAAPHFRTENGNVIKIYRETTAVVAAALVGGGGTTITATDTFDGYTLQQIVKALRNTGLLA